MTIEALGWIAFFSLVVTCKLWLPLLDKLGSFDSEIKEEWEDK